VEEDWVATHPGLLSVGVVTTNDGFIYVTGRSALDAAHGFRSDIVTIKYDLNGNEIWLREFDETDDGTNGTDQPSWIALDPSGRVIVTGESFINESGDDIITLKYDPAGNLLWKARSTAGRLSSRVATDAAGNVYVAGVTSTSESAADFITIKYDPNGNLLWSRVNAGGFGDAVSGMEVSAAGEVVVTGKSSNGVSCFDATTIFYEADGTERWTRTYASDVTCGLDEGSDVALGPNGEIYVGGHVDNGNDTDFLLIRYDAAGNEVWVRTPNEPLAQLASRLRVDSQGNPILTGVSNSDFATLKYDSDGNQLWESVVDILGEDVPINMTIGPDDAVYITGYTATGGSIGTVKLDSDANLQWEVIHDQPVFSDIGWGIALDSTGNVIVTGQSDIRTIRYLQVQAPGDNFSVDLQPIDPPVQIPPTGGSFKYHVTVENISSEQQNTQLWFTITAPNNREILRRPSNLSLAPGEIFNRTLSQKIPAGAPPGSYTFTGSVGTFSNDVQAMDSFGFEKLSDVSKAQRLGD
jgi:hypothetical protein